LSDGVTEAEIVEWLRDERPSTLDDVLDSFRARPQGEAGSNAGRSRPSSTSWRGKIERAR
jgi:hypothetical protein